MLFISFLALFYSSLRFNSGWDFFNYVELITSNDYERIEPLSVMLMKIAYITHVQVFFIISSVVFIIYLYKIFKNIYEENIVSIIGFSSVFFLPVGFLLSLDRVRQFLAIIIFVYLLTLKNKSSLYKFSLVIVSGFFHYTSFLFVPLLVFKVFLTRPINVLIQFFILFFSFFVFPFLAVLISNYLGFYTEYYTELATNEGNKILFLYFLFYLFFLKNFNSFSSSKEFIYYFNIFFIGLVMYSGLSIFGTHVTRVAGMPLMFAPILFAKILTVYSQKARFFFLFLMILLVVLLFYIAANDPIRDPLNNYDLFFFHDYEGLSHSIIRNWYYK